MTRSSPSRQMRLIEDASRLVSPIHAVHPAAKIWVTVVFLVVTASFVRIDPVRLLPLFLYPVILMSLSGLPLSVLFRPFGIAVPFILLLAAAEPFLDTTPSRLAGIPLTEGWISFSNLVLRLSLAVLGAILLSATTPADRLINSLRRTGAPRSLTTQLLLLHRFSHILGLSVKNGIRAVTLRAGGTDIPFRAWGPFTGRILLRTLDRADRIHSAMLCRGFDGNLPSLDPRRFTMLDLLYLLSWSAFFLLARFADIPSFLERLVP